MTDELGSGCSGTVFSARYGPDGREAAVKVIHPDRMRSPRAVRRFHREARALERLSHPNIVQILGSGRAGDGAPYLAMERVDGPTLRRYLSRHGAPRPQTALRWALEIASALEAAHRRSVVHRDLKPSNILLTSDDEDASIRLVDFGLARMIGTHDTWTASEGHLVGTPAYMSPEAALGEFVGPKADLYAFGVILHELLVGQKPFDRAAPVRLLVDRVNAPVHLERLEAAGVDPGLHALVESLLHRDPEARPSAAGVIIDALARYTDDDTMPVPRIRRPVPKWRYRLAALGGVGLTVMAIAWAGASAPAPEPPPHVRIDVRSSAVESHRPRRWAEILDRDRADTEARSAGRLSIATTSRLIPQQTTPAARVHPRRRRAHRRKVAPAPVPKSVAPTRAPLPPTR